MSFQRHFNHSQSRQKLLILFFILTLGSQLRFVASEESSVSEGYKNVGTTTDPLFQRQSEEALAPEAQVEEEVTNIKSASSDSNTNETSIHLQSQEKLERQDADGETDSDSDSEEEVDERPANSPSSSTPRLPTSTRPQPLIIKSHPILTSASMSMSSSNSNNNNRNKPSRKNKPGPDTSMSMNKNPKPMPTLQPIIISDHPTRATVKSPVLMTHQKTEELAQVYEAQSQSQSQSQNQHQIESQQKPNANLKSQLDDLFTKLNAFPHLAMVSSAIPSTEGMLQNFHSIKDAYFEVLERLRDFRNTVSKRFEIIENEIRETNKLLNETMQAQANLTLQQQQQPTFPEVNNTSNSSVQNVTMQMNEMERRFNISRLVDYCVHYILSNSMTEATATWSKLDMMTAPNVEETSGYLRDIVHLVYARNNSNASPIFPFLRKIHGVEKLPLYDFLINGMKIQDDFDGSEIFYIAQYLKERNAVRSSIYSKIPKAVQYAVSGRNVNFVYNDKRTGRHYLHVRDDQIRRDRLNFYIQASQSYSDSRAAVWTVLFESVSDTFRIRNSLYGDYMYVNEEGFVETIPASMAAASGLEFNFVWRKNAIMIQSKSYMNDPLVVVRGGGKFPYYFSLMRENQNSPVAEFLVEPDTLLE